MVKMGYKSSFFFFDFLFLSITAVEMAPFTEMLLTNLFKAMALPGSSENEYIMKGVLAVVRYILSPGKHLDIYLMFPLFPYLFFFSFFSPPSHHAQLLTAPGIHRSLHSHSHRSAHSEASFSQQGNPALTRCYETCAKMLVRIWQ